LATQITASLIQSRWE